LGYPESYYTPPTQALQRIEMVRGAASLQYGTQFGGLLNFKLKQGNPDKKVAFTSENTVGSFGFLNSFNSIGGTLGKVNYYSFYQRKQGDGWRPNSGFEQNTAYLDVYYQVNTKLRLGFELTHMNYLAQQAGGLVDFEFQQNPRQSKRARNWFKVNWNLAALHLDYQLSDKTKINFRNFLLDAQRDALGELGPINRPDPGRERDLIVGRYENFGSEGRLLHRYQLGSNLSTLVFGYRYYQGYTTNQQGDASDGSGPDFEFLNPTNLEQSDYEFPSKNLAFFTENLINLGDKWTLTPGIRYEYIRTTADGYYKEKVLSGGQVIFEQQLEDQQKNERQLVLLGLGLGHRLTNEIEAYANISQNYRAINFSDLAQVNPNLVIDSLLEDEKGSTFDIGLRGQAKDNLIRFDLSGFYLRYNNRIGLTALTLSDPILIEKQVAYRTNIGNARVLGLEGFIEADIWRLIKSDDQHLSVRPFINISLLSGKYLSGSNDIIGNQTELTPPLSLKTGFSGNYKRFNWSFLYTFVKAHYSDATNALRVADATRGLIPTYQIMDLSLSYQFKKYRFQTGLNNLANQSYFTRRATGYPGPGIIPANARSFYFTFRFQL
jgi:Fe(3+) dicitrate transport protein